MSASGASAATGSAIDNAIVIDLDEDEVKAVVKEFDDSALKEAAYARVPPRSWTRPGSGSRRRSRMQRTLSAG